MYKSARTPQEPKQENRFTSKLSAPEIVTKMEETAKPLGFDVHKRDFKVIHGFASLVFYYMISFILHRLIVGLKALNL